MDIKDEYDVDIGSTEIVFETVNLPKSAKNIAMWSNDETKQLIDLYKSLINEVGPFKRFKRKLDMWIEISSQIPTKNFKQCQERLKTLLRRKKKGIEKIYISDAQRKIMDLEDGDENEFQIIRKHRLNFDTDDSPAPHKPINVWSNSETKLLMDLYKRFISEVGPQKKFLHKKDMWAAISTNFENKDPKQCEQRYNTVLKRKTKNVTKVYISKARRKTIDFKPKHNAENTLKTNRAHTLENDIIIEKINCTTQQNTSTSKGNKEVLTISETLLKIAAKKEEGKERRHREKMEAFEKMQNILKHILDTKIKN